MCILPQVIIMVSKFLNDIMIRFKMPAIKNYVFRAFSQNSHTVMTMIIFNFKNA